VSVAGNFSAVVEVVEHSELQRQFVARWSDVCAVHGQRFVAVADGKVAKNLIVGAILFQNVDHVADRVGSSGKFKLAAVRVNEVVFFDLSCVSCEILVDVSETDALNGATDQCRNVRMLLSFALAFQLAQHVVWPAAFSLAVAMSRSLPTIASALDTILWDEAKG